VLITDLEGVLPHRGPMLLLDRVIDLEPGICGIGVRRFEAGDPCFEGHFPGMPILPGVLTIEAMAQTLMVVLLAAEKDDPSSDQRSIGYIQRVQEMSFRRTIVPGEEIHFSVQVEKRLGRFVVASGRATCDGALCAKGSVAVALETNGAEGALDASAGAR